MINIIQTFLIKKVWQTLHWFFYWTIYFTFFVRNKPSPTIRIPNNSIQILTENEQLVLKVTLETKTTYLTEVAPSRSMDPWFDEHDKVILQESNGDVHVGDVVVYAKNGNNSDLIIHQVVALAQDNEGEYLVCRGLNNYIPDRIRVRRNWVRQVLLGVLY